MLESRRLLAAVTAAEFETDEPVHALVFDFDANVSASLSAADFDIFDLSGSRAIPAAQTSLVYDSVTNRATLNLSGVNYIDPWGERLGLLGNGNFEAVLANAAVSPNLSADHTLPFHFWQADFNGDRTVNLDDWTRMAGAFGTAQPYSQGDADYSGTVSLDDFTILANRFGSTLHAPLASPYSVQVGSQTTSSLLVEWTAPTGYVPDGYRLWRSEDGVTFTQLDGVDIPHITGTSQYNYTDTGVLDGKKYWYRVRAYTNAQGSSVTTAKAWGVTTLKAPTDVTASLEDNNEITVRWNAGSERAQGYIVKLYRKFTARGESGFVEVASHTVNSATTRSLTVPNPGDGPIFADVASTNAESSVTSSSGIPERAVIDASSPTRGIYSGWRFFAPPGIPPATISPAPNRQSATIQGFEYADNDVSVKMATPFRSTHVSLGLMISVYLPSTTPVPTTQATLKLYAASAGTSESLLEERTFLVGQGNNSLVNDTYTWYPTYLIPHFAEDFTLRIVATGFGQWDSSLSGPKWAVGGNLTNYFPYVTLTGNGTLGESTGVSTGLTVSRTLLGSPELSRPHSCPRFQD